MIEQGTPEWYAARLGKATASKIQSIVARTNSGSIAAGRKNYMAQLVLERLTGQRDETGFKSASMERGNEVEAQARQAYAFLHSVSIAKVGFIEHPRILMSGCSPDALVETDGVAEFKCPDPAQHLARLTGAKISLQYQTQVDWQLACMPERKWCDHVSFDPRFPEAMRMHVQRIYRDDERIFKLEREVERFLREVDEMVERLKFQFGNQDERAA